MNDTWNQHSAFPIIAEAIEQLHSKPEHFVSHREIVRFLLREPRARKLILLAHRRHQKEPLEEYTGSMVAWFSQQWTTDYQKWSSLFDRFERDKIDGRYAYRPRVTKAIVYADDIEENIEKLPEGAVYERLVNGYERNLLAREVCIKKYGTSCYVCGFSFGATYGEAVSGIIHVHHLIPLSEVGKEYQVDPIADLRPVCPNCHAVIHHRRNLTYSIEEVRSFLRK